MDEETKFVIQRMGEKLVELSRVVEMLANEQGLTYSNDLKMLVSKDKFEELKRNPK